MKELTDREIKQLSEVIDPLLDQIIEEGYEDARDKVYDYTDDKIYVELIYGDNSEDITVCRHTFEIIK